MESKHSACVSYNKTHHNWILSVNLHPYDTEHHDTCMFRIFRVKPTKTQIRKSKLKALKHKRGPQRGYLPKGA